MRLHYTTLGDPKNEAVLVLHGTNGSGAGLLNPAFGGELFGPGQPIDDLDDGVGVGPLEEAGDVHVDFARGLARRADHVAAAHEKARLIQSRQRAIVRIVILSGADAHMRKQRLHFGALHHRVVELLQAYIAFEQRTRNGKLNTEQRIHAAVRVIVF